MKKFLFALTILLVANLSCKKESELCACSPEVQPNLNLAIKSSTGDDLLNPTTAGSFSKTAIQLYYKEANGINKDVNFSIRPPFDYSADVKFAYYQLVSEEIVRLARSGHTTFYLRLGNNIPYELNLTLEDKKGVEKLLIDHTEATIETKLNKYISGPIFYLIK